jgi:hypothetical protein
MGFLVYSLRTIKPPRLRAAHAPTTPTVGKSWSAQLPGFGRVRLEVEGPPGKLLGERVRPPVPVVGQLRARLQGHRPRGPENSG